MKRNLLLGLLAALLCGALVALAARPAAAPGAFYYANSRKIPLTIVPNKVVVRFGAALALEQAMATLRLSAPDAQVEWRDARTAWVTTGKAVNRDSLLHAARFQPGVLTSTTVYTAATGGGELGITDEFLVRYLPTASDAQIAELARKTGSTVKSARPGMTVLRVMKGGDALAAANLYQESGLVEYAHPNFMLTLVKNQVIPNDEFFPR